MIIPYQNQVNQLMLEIGTLEKSFTFSISEILINGLEPLMSLKFSKEEVEENIKEWSDELLKEIQLRESEYNKYSETYYAISHINNILNKINYENNIINLKQLKDSYSKLLNNEVINLEKDLLSHINFKKIKISFNNKEIKHVKQKHKTSCTLACLAMITHQDYNKVFKELKNKYQLKKVFFTNEKQWKDYINEYGYDLKEKKETCDWKDIPDYSVCIVNVTKIYKNVIRDFTHAIIVRRQEGLIWILDPNLENIKYDFWNYPWSLKEYYEIKKKP